MFFNPRSGRRSGERLSDGFIHPAIIAQNTGKPVFAWTDPKNGIVDYIVIYKKADMLKVPMNIDVRKYGKNGYTVVKISIRK